MYIERKIIWKKTRLKYERILWSKYNLLLTTEIKEKMKRKLLVVVFLLLSLLSTVLLSSCSGRVTVTLETNTTAGTEKVKFNKGETIGDLLTPTKVGFEFDGWYYDRLFKNPVSSTDEAVKCTVYAKWIPTVYEKR